MSEDDFFKIIDNLARLNFCGLVNYYSNNEPLLDNRIFEFIKYGVCKLPKAYHILYTNGILLNEEKFQTFIDVGLSYLRIDNYNDKLKVNPNIQKIYNKYKNQKFAMKCEIHLRYSNQVLSNRGGSAPNKPKIKKPSMTQCPLPFLQLIIRADSGVSLCCNDALGKMTLGNIKEQSIEEILTDKRRLEILELMRHQKRNDIELCKGCDYNGSGRLVDNLITRPTGTLK
jgi:radical SAM protein with 4Fe4S-binding SPASM domain